MNVKAEKFINLLKDIFEVDKSDLDFGIYRIMNHKRSVINKFLEQDLVKEIEDSIKFIENNKVELEEMVYSHLTNFFSRYYEEGDFISQRRYKNGVYAIPYEGEEVKLHWVNQDQYYTKTSENFKDYSFKSGENLIHFKLVEAETEINNNKTINENNYFVLYDGDEFVEIDKNNLIINFQFKSLPKSNKQDKINVESVDKILSKLISDSKYREFLVDLQQLRPTQKNKKRTLLEKELTMYTSKNSFDYFIHKNLGEFLRRELDFYIKNEIVSLDELCTVSEKNIIDYIGLVKIIKNIGNKIIIFLEQIENFQKKLWLKKKFVVDCNYCITLDIIPTELYEDILNNTKQIEEWKALFEISEDIDEEYIIKNKYMMIDTKNFDDEFKEKLISTIDKLDDKVNGLLINSDNFQGLKFLENKYSNQIGFCYIDPPYNTDSERFPYKDGYRHSSWLSMMNDRLALSKQLLNDTGNIFVQIDYNEATRLQQLLESVFGGDNYVNEIIWRRKQATSYSKKQLGITNDTIYWFSKTNEYVFNPIYTKDDEHTKKYIKERFVYTEEETGRKYMKSPLVNSLYRPNLKYVFKGINPPENGWLYSKEKMNEFYENGELIIPDNPDARIYRKIYEDTYKGQLIQNLWIDIPIVNPMAKERVEGFLTQKPEALITRIMQTGSQKDDIIMDFFAGSGTTGYSVIKSNNDNKENRKYILMEIGNYFDNILVKRLKNTINNRDINNSSHIFKYIKLEQYEDALNNVDFNDTQLDFITDTVNEEYILSYMLEFETKDSNTFLNIDKLKNPFKYKLKIERNGESQYRNIDLIETFNYLIGLKVEEISRKETYSYDGFELEKYFDGTFAFKRIEGKLKDGSNVLIVWRNLSDNIKTDNDVLNKYFKQKHIETSEYDYIYINGDNTIEIDGRDNYKIKLIDEEFKRLMFEDIE